MKNALKRANAILGTNYRSWQLLSTHEGLTEEFIREFADMFDDDDEIPCANCFI